MARFLDVVMPLGGAVWVEPVLLISVAVIVTVAVAFIVKFVILKKYRQEKFLEEILGDNEEDK